MQSSVLVAETSEAFRSSLSASLKAEGYGVEAVGSARGVAAAWARTSPDAVVLDATLLDLATRRLLERWAAQGWRGGLLLLGEPRGDVPRGALVLPRPVVVQDLLVRLKDLLGAAPPITQLRLRGRVVDLEHQLVTSEDGETSRLTTREADFLRYLATNPGRTIAREELLEKVWGYRLGALSRSRSVDKMLTRLRPKLGDPAGDPHHIFTVYGGGYRFVPLEEEGEATPAAPAPAAAPIEPPGNLPVPGSDFVGRVDDLADLGDDIASGARLITLLGPGGVGKTRLALQQATILKAEGKPSGGIWFCDLTEARQLDDVLTVVADTLEHDLEGDGVRTIGRALAGAGEVLVLLDNVEQVVEVVATTLATWLVAAPRARFLVTSREPLRLAEERCFELDGLHSDDAVALFAQRAAAVRRGFELTPEGRWAAEQIAQHLDHLPLAIELAAARVTALSPERLLQRLEKDFDTVLHSRERGRSARQATLAGAIEWSWNLLCSWEQAALAQCAVFRGGFFLEAAEAVLDLSAHPEAPPVLDVVEDLVRKSLIRRREVAPLGEVRFILYETIRSFAGRKLEATPGGVAAERRAWLYFLALADELGREVTRRSSPEALRRLALEQDNLQAVIRRARATNRRTALQAALALDPLFTARGPRGAHDRLLDDAVALASGLGPEWRARALHCRGESRRLRGDFDRAESDLLLSVALAGEAGQQPLLGGVSLSLGNLRFRQGRGEEATEHYRRALDCARAAGDRAAEAFAIGRLGSALQMVGRVPEAMEHYRQALQLGREAAEDRTAQLMAGSLIVLDLGRSSLVEAGPAAPLPSGALGYASVSQLFGAALPVGRVKEAQRALESALAFARKAGDRLGEAALTASLGLSQMDAEATEGPEALTRAEASFNQALGTVEEVGNALSEASILGNLGRLYHLAGRREEAGTALREGEVLARRIGARRLQAWLSSLFGAVLADEDRISEAEVALDLGRDLAQEASDLLAQGLNLVARGHLDLAAARAVEGPERARLRERAAGRTSEPVPDTDGITPRKMAVGSVDLRLAMRVLDRAMEAAEA